MKVAARAFSHFFSRSEDHDAADRNILAMMRSGRDFSILSSVALRMDWSVTLASEYEEARQLTKSQTFAVVLIDRDLSSNWKHCLDGLIHSAPDSGIILLSRVEDPLLWEEVTTKGGYDVLRKPLNAQAVTAVLSRAITYWRYAKYLSGGE